MKKKQSSKSKPTMYDVARLAGVSQPTVSRVLNQNDTKVNISAETRQRVLDAVSKLGYHPNVIARSLRTRRTQTIALLIADISNGFYHPMVRAVQEVARQHDYEVLISNSDHVYQNERHFCEVMSRRFVDGVIMVPYRLTTPELDAFYTETHIPICVLGEHVDHPYIDVVFLDDERATFESTRWMIAERGYTRFGYIGVSDNLPPGPRRFRGMVRAVTEAGLTLDPRFLQEGDFTMESGRKAAYDLMAVGELPRAIFALNDLMAIGAVLAFQEAGVRVPEDVAVWGFDNIPETTIIRPTLTTVAQDSRDIGIKLSQALFERIDSAEPIGRRVVESPFTLVPRQSA